MSVSDSSAAVEASPEMPCKKHKRARNTSNWQRIRRDVIKRDEGFCVVCGEDTFKQENDYWNLYNTNRQMAHSFARRIRVTRHFREVDHLVPVHRGGTNELDNLRLLCIACHLFKTRNDIGSRGLQYANKMLRELGNFERRPFIEQAIEKLNYRAREVLRHRYGLNGYVIKSLDDVSDIFKVTRERIRQIEVQALTTICIAIETNELPKVKRRKNGELWYMEPGSVPDPLPKDSIPSLPKWTFRTHEQVVLQARVYVYDRWRGKCRPWNKRFVCWARRESGSITEIFNTDGDTAEEAKRKALWRVSYGSLRAYRGAATTAKHNTEGHEWNGR